jgi:hypothetical protein
MAERAAKRRKTAADDDATNQDNSPSTSDSSLSGSETGSSTPPSSPPPSASPHRTKYSQDDLVTLLIGPDERKMLAFGNQLSKNSEFFKSALKKQWGEGQTRVIRLPEDDAEKVEGYLDFVYGRVLPSSAIGCADEFKSASYEPILQLYTFGERILDTSIRNAVIKEILRLSNLEDDDGACWQPSFTDVEVIYEGTPAGSAARRLLVDIQIAGGYAEALDAENLNPVYL